MGIENLLTFTIVSTVLVTTLSVCWAAGRSIRLSKRLDAMEALLKEIGVEAGETLEDYRSQHGKGQSYTWQRTRANR